MIESLRFRKQGFTREKIGSPRNRDIRISSDQMGVQVKRKNHASAGFLATRHTHEEKATRAPRGRTWCQSFQREGAEKPHV